MIPFRLLILNSILFTTLIMSSCNTYKKTVYFQDVEAVGQSYARSFTPTFQPDDLLSILVMSENPEDAIPFNLPVHFTTLSKSNNGYYNGIPSSGGYLIDSLGNLSIPIIGEIHLGGLNRMEASELIIKKLGDYLNNPEVQISILNFKITVLGDVRLAGTFKIPNERITILEALGLAGDLNITGNRENVILIRNEGGFEKTYRIDLTSNDIFTSKIYYLKQNDVIYVEPNRAKRLHSTTGLMLGSFIISITSVLSTLAILLLL